MCTTCGCGEAEVRIATPGGDPAVAHQPHDHRHHHHDQAHPHRHDHQPASGPTKAETAGRTHTLDLEVAVLGKNDQHAAQNREWLAERGITAINLMSSPGAGKTTLLERTIAEIGHPVTVIEGDQETLFDAERIRRAGARTVQVNTGAGCHLDAHMVARALDQLAPEPESLLVIENVGNLVCPALFDLGERRKVVVISVTEGDDKPLKYPHMFAAADLVVLNKIDLLPHVDFDPERLIRDARLVNPGVEVLPLSARTGDHLDTWFDWLETTSWERAAEG